MRKGKVNFLKRVSEKELNSRQSDFSEFQSYVKTWHFLMFTYGQYFPQRISLTADLEAPQLYILIVPFPIYGPDQNLQSFEVVFYSGRQIQTAGSLEVVRVLQDNPENTVPTK